MKYTKTPDEIAIMTECGSRLKRATDALIPWITSGKTTRAVDQQAEKLLKAEGLALSFPTVEGYRWATCLPVNHQAVHTPPNEYVLQPGDVLTIDIGGLYKGYHTDWATTIIVDGVSDVRKQAFLQAGSSALERTLAALGVGVRLGIVGQIMQETIESAGYKVLRDLTGHGIGRELHEEPYIFNVVVKPIEKTYKIEAGFVAAIEIIYSESTTKIVQTASDGWSIDTADRSLAACFEHTIHIDQNGVHILT